MTPERWQAVKAVLAEALERSGPERRAFLDLQCGPDDELRREVESLLESETEVDDFIETPVFRIRSGDSPPLAEGERVGAYRIVREIGRGGMGAVYLAERDDREFERRVALKLIRRGMDSDEILDRFRAERQILARLDHENIAKLLDGGTMADGRPYFVMEHVEGLPIDEYCDGQGLSPRRRLELFRQVCSAVHFAHQNLVVHRDLKPGNIVVTAEGVPKLLDFGIAKLLHPNEEAFALTRVELRPMTPEYASPEQVRGEAISTASDVYSLGVLLYRLLTGRSPYRLATGDGESLSRAICDAEAARPSSVVVRPEKMRQRDGSFTEVDPESLGRARGVHPGALRRQLAGDLDNIVLKAMSKEPGRRYASVDQLADDVERYLHGLPVLARKDTWGYRTAKFVGRHKLGVGLAATLLLVIVGFSVTVTILLNRTVRERDRANSEKSRAETVAKFLEDLFESPDPAKARGEEVKAKDVLDRGAAQIDEQLKDQPAMQADLRETMGRVYRKLGLKDASQPLLESSLRWRRANLPADDPLLVQGISSLASLRRDQGDREGAEKLIREALDIQRQRGETAGIDYARGLNNLGELLQEGGQLDKAEALFKESLAIKRRSPNSGALDLTNSLNNLGRLYTTTRHYEEAERMLREVVEVRSRLAQGRLDPGVATSLNNLASLLEDKGDLRQAKEVYSQVLTMRRTLFGERHSSVARSLNNLGHVLEAQGRKAEAEERYREAVAIAEETLPTDSRDRAVMLRNLASVLEAQGKGVEGEARIREALAIFRAKSPTPWRIADAESVLGACLAAQRRFQDAEPLLKASYPVLAKDPGDGALHADEARERLVTLYTAWGKPEQAKAYRKEM